MTAPDDVRSSFEAWLTKRHGLSTERWADSGNYKYGDTRAWWECWQAAHADMAGEVWELAEEVIEAINDGDAQSARNAAQAALAKFTQEKP